MGVGFLVVAGSLCLTLALIEAWMLVILFTQPGSRLGEWIREPQDLLKSHLDYLLMALFLYAFYLLFSHFQIASAGFTVSCMVLGSLGNPLLFLLRAANPQWKQEPAPLFRLGMAASCLLTTLGYLAAAWKVAAAALAAA